MEVVGFKVEVPFSEVVRLVPELAKALEELRDSSKFEGIHRRPITRVEVSKVEWTRVDPETLEDVGKVFEWRVALGFVGLDSKVTWSVRDAQLEGKVGLLLMRPKWELAGWLHGESIELVEEMMERWTRRKCDED